MKVFVFGNGNLSFEDFDNLYKNSLEKIIKIKDINFILCDYKGVDTLVMEYLKTHTKNVIIYHIGEKPRYTPDKYKTKVSQWKFKGGYSSDEERDYAAIKECTHYLAYDFNSNNKRKSGTLKNIEFCKDSSKINVIEIIS